MFLFIFLLYIYIRVLARKYMLVFYLLIFAVDVVTALILDHIHVPADITPLNFSAMIL